MQDVVGTEPSKWCGGCHDPALLFTGMMDTPVRELIDEPESQVGLGCVMCHSIAVDSSMGQGGYTIEYPPLYQLSTSENPIIEAFHDFIVHLNPEAHRRNFLKPALRDQTAEFCSSCHKVHLDEPVNNYRWIRGFNDYDNWQASGVSGQGARSFYYPATPQTCTDCHMPLLPSDDFGNRDGFVHSHRFPAANTALPIANRDQDQLDATIDFLQNDIVSIDIFAVSAQDPVEEGVEGLLTGELSTTFGSRRGSRRGRPGLSVGHGAGIGPDRSRRSNSPERRFGTNRRRRQDPPKSGTSSLRAPSMRSTSGLN